LGGVVSLVYAMVMALRLRTLQNDSTTLKEREGVGERSEMEPVLPKRDFITGQILSEREEGRRE
jgi:hypothetical protein